MSSSFSFRITRNAEDLAQTISAISQRLVSLEKRQEAIEIKLSQMANHSLTDEIKTLDSVQKLLADCNELLDSSLEINQTDDASIEHHHKDLLAS